jgi:hypothetical protein
MTSKMTAAIHNKWTANPVAKNNRTTNSASRRILLGTFSYFMFMTTVPNVCTNICFWRHTPRLPWALMPAQGRITY